jgi:hypothetical protein
MRVNITIHYACAHINHLCVCSENLLFSSFLWVVITPITPLPMHSRLQSIQIVLNFRAISETTHRKEQFHVIKIQKHPHVPNNPRDLIYKPNETERPQMAALRNVTKITLRNTVTHLYALDSTRKVRTQPLTTRWLNIS